MYNNLNNNERAWQNTTISLFQQNKLKEGQKGRKRTRKEIIHDQSRLFAAHSI